MAAEIRGMRTLSSVLEPVQNAPVEQLNMSLADGFAKVAAPLLKLSSPEPFTWPLTSPKDACVLIVSSFEVYVDQTRPDQL